MSNLGRYRHRDDPHAVLLHIPIGVGQTLPIREKDLHGEAPRYLNAMFSVGRKDEVIWLHGQSRTDLHRLLTFEHRVGADAPLTLQGEHPAVQFSGEDHVAIHLLIQLGG